MSFGGGTSRDVTATSGETGPWAPQQPYILQGFAEALRNFQERQPRFFPGATVAGFSPAEREGMAGTLNTARTGFLPTGELAPLPRAPQQPYDPYYSTPQPQTQLAMAPQPVVQPWAAPQPGPTVPPRRTLAQVTPQFDEEAFNAALSAYQPTISPRPNMSRPNPIPPPTRDEFMFTPGWSMTRTPPPTYQGVLNTGVQRFAQTPENQQALLRSMRGANLPTVASQQALLREQRGRG
jgi:hypothetical protein